MGRSWQSAVIVLLGVWGVAQPLLSSSPGVEAQLSPYYYNETCPQVYPIVARGVLLQILNETRIAASLLRLHFHDCFVQGCDASVLLDNVTLANGTVLQTEKEAPPNANSLRGYSQIDLFKAEVEEACPGVVSCADLIALASFFSVILSAGPIWAIPLGRRDSLQTGFPLWPNLPAPTLGIASLTQHFAAQNLTTQDLVALSGGHTIGIGHCSVIQSRLYNFTGTAAGGSDPSINATLLATLEANCPEGGNGAVTNEMDITTPNIFDNGYYQNLLLYNGLFETDEELFTASNTTLAFVEVYASNQTQFFEDFVTAMIKMGNLNVLTGTNGEIRENCHVSNNVTSVLELQRESENFGTEGKTEGKTDEYVEVDRDAAVEFFKKIVLEVATEVLGEDLGMKVEDTVSSGHFSF